MACFESTKRLHLIYHYFDILNNIHFDYKFTTDRNKLPNAIGTKPTKMYFITPPKSDYLANQFFYDF